MRLKDKYEQNLESIEYRISFYHLKLPNIGLKVYHFVFMFIFVYFLKLMKTTHRVA